ncbi:hypothetical protein GJ496_000900 [Pomphorhynchus laevis]|nr:hypothetical protein GJ496_000900 [Pomphorhynchus laevis]
MQQSEKDNFRISVPLENDNAANGNNDDLNQDNVQNESLPETIDESTDSVFKFIPSKSSRGRIIKRSTRFNV